MLESARITAKVDGIKILYKNIGFRDYCIESLKVLRENDPVRYATVCRHVRSIIELGQKSSFVGYPRGAYIDFHTSHELEMMGPRRYAGYLVRFATHVRLLNEWGIEDAINFGSRIYPRIAAIAVRRELRCCQELGCEMAEIYNIQRWLRQNPGG